MPIEWKWGLFFTAVFLGMVALGTWVIRTVRIMRENEILQRKYGDLPMFADFFRRLELEERRKKGGSS